MILLLVALYIKNRSLQENIRLQTERNKQQDAAARAVLDAEERERNRIAADLHDGVGQSLTAALINLNTVLKRTSFGNTEDWLLADKATALVSESYNEIRSISHQMVPNSLLKAGLVAAVRDFLSNIDPRKLKISIEATGMYKRLDMQFETVLYRIIQELVQNAVKHAEAEHIIVQLDSADNLFTITVEDNGKGFDPDTIKENTWLNDIASRIESLNGHLDIQTEPGTGTTVYIELEITILQSEND